MGKRSTRLHLNTEAATSSPLRVFSTHITTHAVGTKRQFSTAETAELPAVTGAEAEQVDKNNRTEEEETWKRAAGEDVLRLRVGGNRPAAVLHGTVTQIQRIVSAHSSLQEAVDDVFFVAFPPLFPFTLKYIQAHASMQRTCVFACIHLWVKAQVPFFRINISRQPSYKLLLTFSSQHTLALTRTHTHLKRAYTAQPRSRRPHGHRGQDSPC